MSLLTIARSVAGSVGLPRPSIVASSSDQLAIQLFELANETVEELGKKNWPHLDMSYDFPTVVDQAEYALPDDYARFAVDTAWLSSEYYRVRGALTASEWALRHNGMSGLVGRLRYRVSGYPLQIVLVPAPTTVQDMTIEYLSVNLVVGADSTRKPLYVVDTDVSVVPEELVRMGLKWRIKHAKGLDYSEDYNAYQTRVDQVFAQAMNLGSVPVAYRNRFGDEAAELGFPYIPDTGYGP